ncbi:NAD(P)/FAD-dependent oxidoreductase [Sphingomonas cavernae]|uniref:FAD-binding oxidoreductase n=1 Tax=Sphingomonas cavernae TaxID=2320861 RepID=A0A418W635_9SPHN|nr:FAD-binding oxidoreductase [Sphingomonas cavernae]RJF85408.1 FAD-binding oxidoreductase [Sphingomonas cavernae]
MKHYDVAIIGAGMAGASLAAEIARHASVVVLEAEDRPGYHATGRSAAFWSETYGGVGVQPLTSASGPILAEGGFLSPLGSLHIGRAADRPTIDAFLAEFENSNITLAEVDPAAQVPGLRSEWTLGVSEPSCSYIDVAGLHAACLGAARRAGVEVLCKAALVNATRDAAGWLLDTAAGPVRAGIVVNAAGAWADRIAKMAGVRPLGIAAYRRTMTQIRTEPLAPEGLPLVADIGGKFYFKPEPGGRLWLSPHDESPTEPCDAAAEEIDVALAIERFEGVVDWRVAAVEHKWAGLRSFAPDRLPVYGFDPREPGFFWCVGQGGFGIQTAPAGAMLGAALLLGHTPDAAVRSIDAMIYAPGRFDA